MALEVSVRAILLVIFCLALLPLPLMGATAERWAVLSTSTLRVPGLLELVQAQLGDAGIRQVERSQLRRVTDEQLLAAFSNPAATRERLEVGRLLAADYLLLISSPKGARDEVLVVIADTRLGARLCVQRLPAKDKMAAAGQTTKLVLECRQRYAAGVKQIIAAPSFLNDSLTHEQDGLRSRYSRLLQNALLARPGVAVLETDEARAIANEVALGAQQRNRIVPVFLGAKYRVERNGQVRITIDVSSSGDRSRTVERTFPGIEQASAWLAADALGVLLPAEPTKPLSADEQFKMLIERADEASQMGFWMDAAELRMAAVLLKPRETDQRKIAIREAHKMSVAVLRGQEPRRDYESVAAAQLLEWENIEYLVRTGQFTAGEAMDVSRSSITARALVGVATEQKMHLEEVRRHMAEHVIPRILDLKPVDAEGNPIERTRLVREWQSLYLSLLSRGLYPSYITRNELDFRYRMITTKLPPDAPGGRLDYNAETYQSYGQALTPPPLSKDGASVDDLIAFSERLTKAKPIFAKMQVVAPERPMPTTNPFPKPIGIADSTCFTIERQQVNVRTATGKVMDWREYYEGGKGYRTISPPRAIKPGLDISAGFGSLLYMRTKGLLEEVRLGRSLGVVAFESDGRYVWASRSQQDGIDILDTEGKMIASIGCPDPIPPSIPPRVILCVGEGKLLVGGSVGSEKRGWVALIEMQPGGGTPTVKVVLEAKRSPLTDETPEQVAGNPQTCFYPRWFCRLPDIDGQVRVLIGRERPHVGMLPEQADLLHKRPLVLNLTTGSAEVMANDLGDLNGQTRSFHLEGDWVFGPGDKGYFAQRVSSLLDPATPPQLIPFVNPETTTPGRLQRFSLYPTMGGYEQVIDARDGYLYFYDRPVRIDIKRRVAERLGIRQFTTDLRVGYSSFYGLVSVGPTGLDTIRVDPSRIPSAEQEPASEFRERLEGAASR